jgi:hypothetical protein
MLLSILDTVEPFVDSQIERRSLLAGFRDGLLHIRPAPAVDEGSELLGEHYSFAYMGGYFCKSLLAIAGAAEYLPSLA